MSEVVPKPPSSAGQSAWLPALVLAAAAGAWFFLVDTRLIYFRPNPVFPSFLATRRFFAELAVRPGGLLSYLAAYLSQLLYNRAAGALLLTSIGVLLAFGIRLTVTGFGLPGPRVLHGLPVFVLAYAYTRYAHVLGFALALVLVAFLTAGLARIGARRRWLQVAALLVVSLPACYALGGGFALLGVTMAVGEAAGRRRWVTAVLWLILGLGLPPLLGTAVRKYPLLQSLSPLPFTVGTFGVAEQTGWLMMLCLPAAVVGGALRPRPETAGAEDGQARATGWGVWAAAALIMVVAVGVLWASVDRYERLRLRVEFLSHQERWDELLSEARGIPSSEADLLVTLSVNRALYHAGRLPYDLFAYPQFMYGLVRAPEEFFYPQEPREPKPHRRDFMRMSDIFFELGRVNEAEHMATEALEDQGYRPWILERMGLSRVAKGQWESGRSFLAALARDPVFGSRGRQYLAMMESDPLLEQVPEVSRARSLMSLQDTAGPVSIERHLELLLEREPSNRMAMEYLMAHYLLTGDLAGFVSRLGRAVALAGGRVSELYQEALLVQAATAGGDAASGEGFVSPEIRARFDRFSRVVESHAGDRQGAMRALGDDFRESYFPYYVFFLMQEQQ